MPKGSLCSLREKLGGNLSIWKKGFYWNQTIISIQFPAILSALLTDLASQWVDFLELTERSLGSLFE